MNWFVLFLPLIGVVVYLLLVPLAGAALLLGSVRLARMPSLGFTRTWKVYITATANGMIVVIGLSFLLPWLTSSAEAIRAIQVAATILVQLLVVTVMLRPFSRRSFVSHGAAVLLTNLATLAAVITIQS